MIVLGIVFMPAEEGVAEDAVESDDKIVEKEGLSEV